MSTTWVFVGVGILAMALAAWSVFGLARALKALRRAEDPRERVGLRVTVAILSVRLALVAVVAALMVRAALQA